jgi:hypothetical protein
MKRLFSIARARRLSALMTIGGGLLLVPLLGCPGTLDPALAGGGGGASGGVGGAGGAADCADTILMTSCAIAGACHNASIQEAGLNLTPPVPASRLIGVQPNSQSLCSNGQVFLQAGSSPASGILLDNLKPSPPCGFQMPYIMTPLVQSQIDCLQQWANGLTAGGADAGAPGQ